MSQQRKRVLIVNCYFPEIREPVKLPNEVPNALAPIMLAGAFRSDRCEVRLYNEVSQGFIEVFQPELLSWPDMVVLTGLTDTFDRMLHITAYTRTANPRVIVVAGGYAVRSLPSYSKRFFDYACQGDVEQMVDVVGDAFGTDHADPRLIPRYDLGTWIGHRIAYVESSRNCNYRCSFCTLTARGDRYSKLSLDALRQQIVGLGRREILLFVDNQFHGADRRSFVDRLELLRDLRQEGYFRYWSAFVTDSFFWNEADIELARQSGCFSVLVGVESFDEEWLNRVNKAQNNRVPQVKLIQRCLEAGILFQYGLVFDGTERTVEAMRKDLRFILDTPEVPPPNFIFNAIPFPATPLFHQRHAQGLLLPNVKVRDLEGSTVTMRPLDGVDAVAEFLATAKNLKRQRLPALRHHVAFLQRYHRYLNWEQSLASSLSLFSFLAPATASNLSLAFRRRQPRTHVCMSDRLDCVYEPQLRVDSKYASYFRPTMITTADGNLNEDLVDDLMARRYDEALFVARGVPV
jgi:hopanoid C-2 methylase